MDILISGLTREHLGRRIFSHAHSKREGSFSLFRNTHIFNRHRQATHVLMHSHTDIHEQRH